MPAGQRGITHVTETSAAIAVPAEGLKVRDAVATVPRDGLYVIFCCSAAVQIRICSATAHACFKDAVEDFPFVFRVRALEPSSSKPIKSPSGARIIGDAGQSKGLGHSIPSACI